MTEVTVPKDESTLTERQADVLRLYREGKSPTEIGKELDISSQGVHGHLRRLRAHGLIEGDTPKPPAAPRRARSNAVEPFDPADSIRAVVRTITAQLDALNAREADIDAEIARLQAEKKQIGATRKELDKLIPAGTGVPSETK
jgi:predicted ArsR family transcriptional regulator